EEGDMRGGNGEALGKKPAEGIAEAGSEKGDECDPHLARRNRPDHDRHQQDAAERNEIWNAQICAPARPARLAVTIGRRTCGHARISIAAIKPLHRRGFPSTEARKQNEGRAMAETGLTYAEAGVDLDTGDRRMEPLLGSTARAG